MAQSTRYITETIEVTLTVTEGTTETAVDADAIPTAEIYLHSQVVATIEESSVTHSGTGIYVFDWNPANAGIHVVVWTWEYDGEEYESEYKIEVLADPQGTVSDDADDADPGSGLPSESLCTVTATFYTASGEPLEGVYARFSPLRSTDSFVSSSVIVQETDASSDEDGELEMTLVRGVRGTLAITGIGIVREVEVPDQGTITLDELVALSDDPLEVQVPSFTSLIRRS